MDEAAGIKRLLMSTCTATPCKTPLRHVCVCMCACVLRQYRMYASPFWTLRLPQFAFADLSFVVCRFLTSGERLDFTRRLNQRQFHLLPLLLGLEQSFPKRGINRDVRTKRKFFSLSLYVYTLNCPIRLRSCIHCIAFSYDLRSPTV